MRKQVYRKLAKQTLLKTQNAAFDSIVQAKRLSNAEVAWDAVRRRQLAATHLMTTATTKPANEWRFVSGLDGTERELGSSDLAATHPDGQSAASAADGCATAATSSDGTPRGASGLTGGASLQSATAQPARWKGDRVRPLRAVECFANASASSAVERLLGVTSARQASSAGRAAGPASSPAFRAS